MTDFADKAFEAANEAYKQILAALQTTGDKAKDLAETAVDQLSEGAHQIQDRSRELWLKANTLAPPPPPPPPTKTETMWNFASNHKVALGIFGGIPLSLFVGYKVYELFFPYKRRAQKLASGHRFEAILVVGNPESHFVQKMIHDLNARGYILFVTATDEKQLRVLENEDDQDVRALILDYENATTVRSGLLKLAKFFDKPVDGMYYHFRGCLFVPDYFRMPKIKSLTELTQREFERVLEEQFLQLNTLLANGLRMFLEESNNRLKSVQEFDGVTIKGGYAKLIFVNFLVYARNEGRMLLMRLSKAMNQIFFEELYNEIAPGWEQSIYRLFGTDKDASKIDMSTLTVLYEKDTQSRLISDSIFDKLPAIGRRLSSKDVHYKIYDLLNSQWLGKSYYIHN